MKEAMKLLLIVFMYSCAVQGPIPGGEVDKTGPQLIRVYPENNSTTLQENDRITFFFNEAIDPNSVYDSFKINNDKYKIRVIGKRVIIKPKDKWDAESILNISVSRNLMDYYKNSISSPLDFHFSLGKDIPKGIIRGTILDILDTIEKYNDINFNSSIYEVALYEKVNSEMLLISKTETNQDLKFNFSALDSGSYSILVVKDGIYNPPIDISQRSFSIHNEDIHIDEVNLEHEIIINVGEPIAKKNISSIDFINNYFVNYNFTDGSSQFGILDTVIYNINKDHSGTKHSIQINLDNDFESYLTDIFDFVIPSILDTISPEILSCEIVDSKLSISLSEPLKECCADNAFYILDDEKNIPLDGYSYSLDDPLEIKEIVLPKNHQDSLNVYLTSDTIRDFYGNTLIDSVLQIKDCNNNSDDSVNTEFQSGGLYGEVLRSSTKNLVIAAYNIETKEPWFTISENNYFSFNSLPAGEYFLQAYENYTMESEVAYPYFAGSWNPFKGSVNFSKIIGPVEIRKNWDIDGIKIKFD